MLEITAGKRKWRVNAGGQATLVAALAGVVSLPNGTDRYASKSTQGAISALLTPKPPLGILRSGYG